MTRVRRFEDLLCWQKARLLANAIHELAIRPGFSRDFKLREQIEDASGSVMHNIAEGHDAGTDTEFMRFLRIARRSASEVQSELYLAGDRGYITEPERQHAHLLADEAKRLINGLIAYLRKPQTRGSSNSEIKESAGTYLLDPLPTSDERLSD